MKDLLVKMAKANISIEQLKKFLETNKGILSVFGFDQQIPIEKLEEYYNSMKLPLTVVYNDGVKCDFFRPDAELEQIEYIYDNGINCRRFYLHVDNPGILTEDEVRSYCDEHSVFVMVESEYSGSGFNLCHEKINEILKKFGKPEIERYAEHWVESYSIGYKLTKICDHAALATSKGNYGKEAKAIFYPIS